MTFAEPTGFSTLSYVFPDLIVMMLTPGELITQVNSNIIWYCAVYLVELIFKNLLNEGTKLVPLQPRRELLRF
jgi:hypothetical protein